MAKKKRGKGVKVQHMAERSTDQIEQTEQVEQVEQVEQAEQIEQAEQAASSTQTPDDQNEQKSALVIGLGLYGATLAARLHELGWFVLAIDRDKDVADHVANQVMSVRILDASNLSVMKTLNPERFDVCVCALGQESLEAVTFTVFNLSELNAKRIICRSINEQHDQMFRKMGAKLILNPEKSFAYALSEALHRDEFEQLVSDQNKGLTVLNDSKRLIESHVTTPNHRHVGEPSAARQLFIGLQLVIMLGLLFTISAQNATLRPLQTQEQWYQSWLFSMGTLALIALSLIGLLVTDRSRGAR